jgi:hypothetical protein
MELRGPSLVLRLQGAEEGIERRERRQKDSIERPESIIEEVLIKRIVLMIVIKLSQKVNLN